MTIRKNSCLLKPESVTFWSPCKFSNILFLYLRYDSSAPASAGFNSSAPTSVGYDNTSAPASAGYDSPSAPTSAGIHAVLTE